MEEKSEGGVEPGYHWCGLKREERKGDGGAAAGGPVQQKAHGRRWREEGSAAYNTERRCRGWGQRWRSFDDGLGNGGENAFGR